MVYSASMVAATKGTLTVDLKYLVRISTTAYIRYYEFYCRIFIAFMLNIKILQKRNTEVDHDNHLRVTIFNTYRR